MLWLLMMVYQDFFAQDFVSQSPNIPILEGALKSKQKLHLHDKSLRQQFYTFILCDDYFFASASILEISGNHSEQLL